MKDETERPTSVLITQGVLLLSTLVFFALATASFLLGESLFTQILYGVLLVICPATALFALIKRLTWGRRLAMFSMMFIWAFALKAMWSNLFLEPSLFGSIFYSPIAALLFFAPAATLVGLPYLFWKLGFSPDVEAFFHVPENGLAAGEALYIGDSVTGFDEGLFEREAELAFKE